MANICSNYIGITSSPQVIDFIKTIDFEKSAIYDRIKSEFGLNPDYRCYGFYINPNENTEENALYFDIDTAWGPNDDLWKGLLEIIKADFPGEELTLSLEFNEGSDAGSIKGSIKDEEISFNLSNYETYRFHEAPSLEELGYDVDEVLGQFNREEFELKSLNKLFMFLQSTSSPLYLNDDPWIMGLNEPSADGLSSLSEEIKKYTSKNKIEENEVENWIESKLSDIDWQDLSGHIGYSDALLVVMAMLNDLDLSKYKIEQKILDEISEKIVSECALDSVCDLTKMKKRNIQVNMDEEQVMTM